MSVSNLLVENSYNLKADTVALGTKSAGIAQMSGGTIVVPSTLANALKPILLTSQSNSVLGVLRVSAFDPGVSFTITSSIPGDAGSISWLVLG